MTKYREILRLTAKGLSQRNIMQSIGVAQKTVVRVQHRAKELKLTWPLDESLTDQALERYCQDFCANSLILIRTCKDHDKLLR